MTPIKPAAEALERRAEAMRTLACCQMKLTVLSEALQDLAAAVEGSASHRLTVSPEKSVLEVQFRSHGSDRTQREHRIDADDLTELIRLLRAREAALGETGRRRAAAGRAGLLYLTQSLTEITGA